METLPDDDFKNGSAFFGFMGVSMALVLASKYVLMKILAQPMAQQRQAQASAASPFGSLLW